MTPEFVNIDEIREMVEDYFGQPITRSAVYGYIRRKSFPHNLGIGRPRLWRKDDVLKWLESFSVAS